MELFLAKPVGITLKEHTNNVINQARELIAARPFVCRKYQKRTGQDLSELVLQSAEWHDAGKADPQWQSACRKEYEEYKKTGKVSGKHLLKAGIRHEFSSLIFLRTHFKIKKPLIETAIAAHHGKLGHRYEKRWREPKKFEPYWLEMRQRGSGKENNQQGFEEAIHCRYEMAGPRAWLQMADYRASASEPDEKGLREELPTYSSFSYQFHHDKKRDVQIIIEELWDEPFAILRAPTGSGKTDAALLWAQHQINLGRADRLIMAMPTRFTANTLAINVADTLSTTGLYHSSAWYQKIEAAEDALPKKRIREKELEMARLLETPITITTIDHLCICLTATRESHHSIFFNLAHSCVVIDEADFYDTFTQQNIVILLHVLRLLEVPVLLMSATVPQSAKSLYSTSGYTINKIYEDTSNVKKKRWQVIRHKNVAVPDDIEDILEKGLGNTPLIIYANTVKRAQAYYNWFNSRKGKNIVLYHSRFTEPHKAQKENALLSILGRNAWKDRKQCGVAILTQIGELSVNISTDLMISDLCPIDRLAQRAGRLSRFPEIHPEKQQPLGQLYVVRPIQNQSEIYPAPYGNFDQQTNRWITSHYFNQSDKLLKEGEYSAQDFTNLVDNLYADIKEIEPEVRRNVRALKQCIRINWMILPKQQIDIDENHTKEWQSRNIPYQNTVIIDNSNFAANKSERYRFRNRSQFRQYILTHGIQIATYEFNRAKKNQMLKPMEVIVGEDDQETLWLVDPRCYSEERGLDLQSEE